MVITRLDDLVKNYPFAVSAGYKGAVNQYVDMNYAGYVKSMKRNSIAPLSFDDWCSVKE
jgi:hypothetical protein